LHFKSHQESFVFALRAEVRLIATCVFAAGKIKSIRLLKDFGDDQTVRLGGQHLKGNDLAVGTNYQLCSLAKLRSDVRVAGETFRWSRRSD